MGAFDKIHAYDTKRNIAKGRYNVDKIDELFREYGTLVEHETEYELTKFMLNVFCVALHDEFGFSKQRLSRVMAKVQDEISCYDLGTVNATDFATILKDECGYEIEVRMVED